MTDFTFNDFFSQAQAVEESSGLKDGWHKGRIESAEILPTKNGDGRYLKIAIRGIKGHLVICNINLQHPNPVVTEIGLNLLKRLKLALGILLIHDSPSIFVGKLVEYFLKTSKTTGEQQIFSFRSFRKRPTRGQE